MNLPKKLEKFRDEKSIEELGDHYFSYDKGFNAACEILLPEIEKMREALVYCRTDYTESNCGGSNDYEIEVINKALKQWQEFAEGE